MFGHSRLSFIRADIAENKPGMGQLHITLAIIEPDITGTVGIPHFRIDHPGLFALAVNETGN